MTSMTFKIFKLKFSTRSSAEHGLRGGSKEMAFLKSTLDSSLIYRFLTVFDFFCMSGIKDILKETQKVVRQGRISHREIRNIEALCDNQV